MLKDVSRVAMVVGGASAPNKKGALTAPFLCLSFYVFSSA